MRGRWARWLVVVLAVMALAWYFDWFAPVRHWLSWLASAPSVREAFRDPEHGRLDAMLMLMSFSLVAPALLLVAALALAFVLIVVALLFEPLLRLLRLPGWTSVPMVLVAVGYVAYTLQPLWVPYSMHVLGLVARAGIVYFSPVAAPLR
jgi:hypothetical protein